MKVDGEAASPQLYFSETRVGVGQILFSPASQIHPDIMEVWGAELRNALGNKRPHLGSPCYCSSEVL